MGDYETGELVESVTLKYQTLLVCVVIIQSYSGLSQQHRARQPRESQRGEEWGRNKLHKRKV